MHAYVCLSVFQVRQTDPDGNSGIPCPTGNHLPEATHMHATQMLIRIRFPVLECVLSQTVCVCACVYEHVTSTGELEQLVSHQHMYDDLLWVITEPTYDTFAW